MIGALTDLRDRVFGRGRHSVTLPPMDGALRPNTALEEAAVLVEIPAPSALTAEGESLWFASGARLCTLGSAGLAVAETFAAPVTAFARAPDGRRAVATADGGLHLPPDLFPDLPPDLQPAPDALPAAARRCITGLAFDPSGALLVTVGSAGNPAAGWQKDLLEHGCSGSLWRLSPAGAAQHLAQGLAWPEAPLAEPDGSILFAESSAARVLRRRPDGRLQPVIAHLPGYPAGIARLGEGYALCLKAPRNQLIEFLLREPDFCARMIRDIPPAHWIAPSLTPPQSFLEPLQGGALKQLGMMKPWAPSRSSGLVIELDAGFTPLRSHHSRADGRRHGTLSCAPFRGGLAVAAAGGNCILNLGTAP